MQADPCLPPQIAGLGLYAQLRQSPPSLGLPLYGQDLGASPGAFGPADVQPPDLFIRVAGSIVFVFVNEEIHAVH